jgi:hypothetical protein
MHEKAVNTHDTELTKMVQRMDWRRYPRKAQPDSWRARKSLCRRSAGLGPKAVLPTLP